MSRERWILMVAVLAGGILAARKCPTTQVVAGVHHGLPEFDQVMDLGTVEFGQNPMVSFPIRNFGNRRLVVNEVDVQCNCGLKILSTLVIQPGETKYVSKTLDTRFASGPIETIAAFRTNNPDRPDFQLITRAWIDDSSNSVLQPTLADVDVANTSPAVGSQSEPVSILNYQ